MRSEILTEEQRKLLPLIRLFAKGYYLVGGTAIALYRVKRAFGLKPSIQSEAYHGMEKLKCFNYRRHRLIR